MIIYTYATLDIKLTLDYLAMSVSPYTPFDYTTDAFINNDETEYNNIVWNDVRTQPTWFDIEQNWESAILTYYNTSRDMYFSDLKGLYDLLNGKIEALQIQINALTEEE